MDVGAIRAKRLAALKGTGVDDNAKGQERDHSESAAPNAARSYVKSLDDSSNDGASTPTTEISINPGLHVPSEIGHQRPRRSERLRQDRCTNPSRDSQVSTRKVLPPRGLLKSEIRQVVRELIWARRIRLIGVSEQYALFWEPADDIDDTADENYCPAGDNSNGEDEDYENESSEKEGMRKRRKKN